MYTPDLPLDNIPINTLFIRDANTEPELAKWMCERVQLKRREPKKIHKFDWSQPINAMEQFVEMDHTEPWD